MSFSGFFHERFFTGKTITFDFFNLTFSISLTTVGVVRALS